MNGLGKCLMFCLFFSLSLSALAQGRTVLEQAKIIELASLQEGVETQQRIDQIDDERISLFAEFRASLKQLDDLKDYNNHLRSLTNSQEEEMLSLKKQGMNECKREEHQQCE